MPDIDTSRATPSDAAPPNGWHQSACILCSINCGIEVRLDGRRFARIRGDKAHPASAGYTCEKALRLDHYQNDPHRLTTPLRRRPDGSFEAVDWDTAIAEVAARLVEVRDTHGGERIFYYGGGGQGNHLGGSYATALRKAAGVAYTSNALAQEKTGEFWVDGQLFGRPRCHTTPDLEHTEMAVFVGKNPWQSHGFPRARTVLKAIANDPGRYMVVIDPRRTETAALADVHLQVRPGTDAWCLTALLAVLVDEGLVDRAFVADRTTGSDELFALLRQVPIADYCARSGVAETDVRAVARRMSAADSVAIYEDLGIQQAPHSTLGSYLEKLLYLLVGSFGKPGGMNIHTRFASLGGSGPSGGSPSSSSGSGSSSGSSAARRPGGRTSPVTGSRIITGLVPGNVIADEILTDHPDRFRAMIVESANPAHSLADSQRMRQALEALDLVVVIDVALTETARLADYVLPAASQFEKPEATFFTLEFPSNVFHLRRPLFDPLPGTLPEAEIHTRLVRAMGALDGHDDELARLRAAADEGLAAYGEAFFGLMLEQPQLFGLAPVIVYETLGPTLPDGLAGAASVWALAQLCAQNYPEAVRRAGYEGDGLALGDALFQGILDNPSGVVFTVDPDDETWRRLDTLDERIHLVIPELLPELEGLRDEDPTATAAADGFPFVLSAGERRSSTANTIYRDPGWRKKDVDGALRLNPGDAARLGVADGGRARVTTRRGSIETVVELTDTLQPGHASLPNGLGLTQPAGEPAGPAAGPAAGLDGPTVTTGVPPNELTASGDRDWLAGTPWHKHVRARIEAVEVVA